MSPRRRQANEGGISSYETKGGLRYRYDARVPNGEGGSKRRARGGFLTREEAAIGLLELRASIRNNSFIDESDRTVQAYIEEWLDGLRHTASTMASYRKNARLHVIPHIGATPVQAVTGAKLAKLYRTLETSGRRDKNHVGEGLAPKTVRLIHNLLSAMFKDALEDGLILSNPAASKAAKPPTVGQVKAATEEVNPWSADEVNAFVRWSASINDDLHAAWVVMLRTGVRRGELLGLRWGDVDTEASVIRVRRSAVIIDEPGRPERVEIKGTKGGKPRVIDVGAPVLEALRAHKVMWGSLDLSFVQPGAYVFGRPDGSVWNPHRFGNRFRARLIQCKRDLGTAAPHAIRMHDLRHTHATLLLLAGVQPKVVQERLGHSSITITMETYSHVLPSMQRSAVDRLDALLGS